MGLPLGTLIGTGVGAFFGGPAGAAVGATAGSGIDAWFGGQETNAANAQQAQKNRDFQESMSRTAHQRQVADLEAAGLNPILSANAGASQPSGATAVMENAAAQNAASARDAAAMFINLQKQKAEIGVLKSQEAKNIVEAKVATKGIPQADMINEAYSVIRPIIKKAKELGQSNSRQFKEFKENLKGHDSNFSKQPIKLKAGKP